MRLKHLLSVFLMLITCAVGNVWGDVSFSKSDFSWTDTQSSGNPISATKNGVTITCTAANIPASNNYVTFSKNSTLTISSTSGNITAIDFTTSGSGYTGNMTDVSEISTTEWSTTVTCEGQKTTVRVASIVVTVEASCTIKPTVGSDLTSVSATINSITATIPISNIGGCNITENGLVYSTSVTTPTVGTAGCTKVTTTACGATAANKEVTISNLDCGTTYYVRGYAINGAGTQYTTTIAQATSSCPKYTVTFHNAAGSTPSAVTQASYGSSVSIPSATACDGWVFVGWKVGNAQSETTSNPTGSDTWITSDSWPKSYTPTGNIDVYAVFSKTVGSKKTTLLSSDFEDDEDGKDVANWPTQTATYRESDGTKILRFSANSSTGSITSKTLTAPIGTSVKVAFKIKDWGDSGTQCNVSLSNCATTQSFSTSSYTTFTDIEKTFTTASTTTFTVTIAASANKKRFKLDNIEVYYGGDGTTTWTSSPDCCQPLGSINGSFS